MEKIKEIIKKIFSKEVISYLVFGVLTTLVNLIVSFLLKKFFDMNENIASTIGIICSILFAYFTNRKWVFESSAKTAKETVIEFLKFILGRAFTMAIEIFGVWFLVSFIQLFYNMFSESTAFLIDKFIITVIVVILNFFISKFFTFKKAK